MEKIKKDGLAKSVGVSNFREEDLQALEGQWEIPPAVNQVSTLVRERSHRWRPGLLVVRSLPDVPPQSWPSSRLSSGLSASAHTLMRSLRSQANGQIEYHPYVAHEPLMKRLRAIMDKHGIKVQAYAPLAPLHSAAGGPVDSAVQKIADDEDKSPAQVLLQWAAQYGGGTVVT